MTTALVPFNELQQMGSALARSGLFGLKTPEQAIALMLVAQAEGMHPATVAQDYDVIQGRAARKTHSVLARFQQAGGRVEWHRLDEQTADATFSHPQGGSLRMVWTFEQAKKAGLTGKDNWKNYPRAMLRARCIAEGVRAVYPAAIGGALIAEEAMDLAPAPAPAAPKIMGAVEEVQPAQDQGVLDAKLSEARNAATEGTVKLREWWDAQTEQTRIALKGELRALRATATEADEAIASHAAQDANSGEVQP